MPPISDEPATQQLLVSDLLGLAGYLADAVADDHVSADAAHTELANAAHADEARSLRRAAKDAALVYGPDSIATSLLRAAAREEAVA
jgi:hypothetical protein